MGKIQPADRTFNTLKNIKTRLSYSLLVFSAAVTHAEIAPEAPSGFSQNKSVFSRDQMAVTANPYATNTAIEILNKGGSAIDAAIAAQLVLGLVEPQSSGIGGGGFLLHWQKDTALLSSFDGRETAPMDIDENHFLQNQKPLAFFDAVIGGHSVGTPGLLAMMKQAHSKYGKLTWAELFQPAITLSETGFLVSNRLNQLLSWVATRPESQKVSDFKAFYYRSGKAIAAGAPLKNPAYAKTLKAIAEGGPEVFYQGYIAKAIVEAVQTNKRRPGKLQLSDLSGYQAKEYQAICKTIEQYTLCGPPPPASGPIAVMQQISLLSKLPSPYGIAHDSAAFYHRFAESSKLAFADRNQFIADPAFAQVDTDDLLDDKYLSQRAKLIPIFKASKEKVQAGKISAIPFIQAQSPELPSTSHLSIVDSDGNIVSMTSSIETAFGSQIMAAGFLLNNQLTDFSFTPSNESAQLIANRVEPGKRPRSSMAPMIVFKNDKPVLVVGSPGGSRIINYVSKTIFQNQYLEQNLENAITSSHVTNLNGQTEVEKGKTDSKELSRHLSAMGHQVKEIAQTSGIHAIEISPAGLKGVADPRREGTARGE